MSGLQEELHQLQLGLNQDYQEIADSVTCTQANEDALHKEAKIQKLLHQGIGKGVDASYDADAW